MSRVDRYSAVLSLAVLAIVGTGCHAIRITEPARTATEQLLMSTATDEAVGALDLSSLTGKWVFVDGKYFEGYDTQYALGAIRDAISANGALLTNKAEEADVIVEARSGALGIDSRDALLGLPELTIPVPFAGQIESPELAIYKAQKADSVAKFALLAYERESGKHVESSGSLVGKAKFYHYRILGFINWRSTDIPEHKSGG